MIATNALAEYQDSELDFEDDNEANETDRKLN